MFAKNFRKACAFTGVAICCGMCGNCEVEAAMLPVGAVVPAGGHAPVGGHAPAGAVVPVGNAANDIRWQLIGAGAIGLFGAAAVVAVNRGRDARRNADWAEMLQNANNMCLQQKEQLENENSVLRGNVTMHLHENVQCWKARREGDQVALTQCLEDKRALNRHWATYHDNYNQTQTLLNKCLDGAFTRSNAKDLVALKSKIKELKASEQALREEVHKLNLANVGLSSKITEVEGREKATDAQHRTELDRERSTTQRYMDESQKHMNETAQCGAKLAQCKAEATRCRDGLATCKTGKGQLEEESTKSANNCSAERRKLEEEVATLRTAYNTLYKLIHEDNNRRWFGNVPLDFLPQPNERALD